LARKIDRPSALGAQLRHAADSAGLSITLAAAVGQINVWLDLMDGA